MEQNYRIIDKKMTKLSKETPCCIDALIEKQKLCIECHEWTSVLDPCCPKNNTSEIDSMCSFCYNRWVEYDY